MTLHPVSEDLSVGVPSAPMSAVSSCTTMGVVASDIQMQEYRGAVAQKQLPDRLKTKIL
jgi:hypothetical protein